MKANLTANVDLDAIANIVHPDLELIDPTPDVSLLAKKFNEYFFENRLNDVKVYWSKKMITCSGITYMKDSGIVIRLSEPVLRTEKRKSVVETLLVRTQSIANVMICASNER